jgi:ABC-type transport system involved in cytochrome c biogenesis permease subunit
MKKWLPWIIVAVFAAEFFSAFRTRPDKDFAFNEFGRLPVLLNGRIQPIDSVARNALLQIRGTQDVPLEGNAADGSWGKWEDIAAKGGLSERNWYQFTKHPKKLKPAEWILEAMVQPDKADTRHVFLIHHPDLLGELKLQGKGVEKSGLHYFTFKDLQPHLKLIEEEARKVPEKAELRTPYQKSLMSLNGALSIYLRLKVSLQPNTIRPTLDDFNSEIASFEKAIPAGFAALRQQQMGMPHNQQDFDRILEFAEPYSIMSKQAYPLLIPPLEPGKTRDDWSNMGRSLLDAIRQGELHPAVKYYATMSSAFHQQRPADFNQGVTAYRQWLVERQLTTEVAKGSREFFFNNLKPFLRAMIIYIVAFLLGCAFWFNWSGWLRQSAYWLLVLGFIIHTIGLGFRMWLEGRPPVTNLYSSAIFIGWGSIILGLVLERFYRDGIGIVVASLIGFVTQIIAHNLATGGDTMEMLQAVLDTNFWLATHVVIITLGYASTFVAGFLATIYIARGVFTKTLGEATAKGLTRMVYGIVCFATLFSFVGTVLGGIWADQSWGRFWGWDPKENGALLIVIWNALILHARWGGMIKEHGLMNLAIFGNVVTAWSWFGVNMLGVGLHSYGFMDSAFKWLMLFVGSQLLLIALGLLPLRYWRSAATKPPSPPEKPAPRGKPMPA